MANLAGPPLTAMFAYSPYLDGRRVDLDSARTRIWLGVDPRRTGYDGRHLDVADPIGAYADFAAREERFPIPEASASRSAAHLADSVQTGVGQRDRLDTCRPGRQLTRRTPHGRRAPAHILRALARSDSREMPAGQRTTCRDTP